MYDFKCRPNYKDISDLPAVYIKSSSPIFIHEAVHQLMNIPYQPLSKGVFGKNDDLAFMYNKSCFHIPVSNNDVTDTLEFIKNIVQQKNILSNRHIVIIKFCEPIKPYYITMYKSLIQSYVKSALFILHGNVPPIIANVYPCVVVTGTCPYSSSNEDISVAFIKKHLKKMSKIDLYDLRAFALKILASGMPIHKFANVVFAEYPHKCSEIAKFEHDMLLSNKQLFILENFLLNMFKQ